ncbi:MAG: hypothetical protein ABSB74_03870 [Tepidisphaeraceae bacterium]
MSAEMEQSHEPSAVLWEALRKLGFEGRVKMTFELGNTLRRVSEAGVRHRHPDYDERRVRLAALKLAIGPELFKLAFGSEDVEP